MTDSATPPGPPGPYWAPGQSAAPATPETPLYVGRYVIPSGYAKAAARAFGRFQISRPAVWVPFVIFVLAFGFVVWITSVHGTTGTTLPLVFLVIAVVAIAAGWIQRTRTLERQLAVNAQPGGVYQVTLTRSFITMQTPNASSTVRYEQYEKLTEQGDFLLLKVRGARVRSIVPRGLFTDDAVNILRARIPQ